MKLPRRNFLHLAAGAAALPTLSQREVGRGGEICRHQAELARAAAGYSINPGYMCSAIIVP